jgi:uncharacterized oxidoreductase
MKMTDNTILITGGGSGIGKALAKAFDAQGNKVIIAGRRKEMLDAVVVTLPNIEAVTLDIGDVDSINNFVTYVEAQYPNLNTIIHNAGMMQEEIIGENDIKIAEETIAVNLLGPIRLNSKLLPILRKQSSGTIMTVSSGLAFVPRASHPTYCATKAAIHSYTQSLRYQLEDSNLQVIELIPPYVQTQLTGLKQATDTRAMPLTDFIDEVLNILANKPDIEEVCVERVHPQRYAEADGNYVEFFKMYNNALRK